MRTLISGLAPVANGKIAGNVFERAGVPLEYVLLHIQGSGHSVKVHTKSGHDAGSFEVEVPVGAYDIFYQGSGRAWMGAGKTVVGSVKVAAQATAYVDIFLDGKRSLSGNLELEKDGVALTVRLLLSLRPNWSNEPVATAVVANLVPPTANGLSEDKITEPWQRPGYFEFVALKPDFYVLEVKPDGSGFEDLLVPWTKEIDLRSEDKNIGTKNFTLASFFREGLKFEFNDVKRH